MTSAGPTSASISSWWHDTLERNGLQSDIHLITTTMTGSKGPAGSGRQGRASHQLPTQETKSKPETSTTTKLEREHDNSFPPGTPDSGLFNFTAAAAFSNRSLFSLRTIVGTTIALYILNQSHCLPKPLSAVVSKCLFWPSLPITVSRRIGRWTTQVDETVLLGGAPFGFVKIPERLYRDYGVSWIPCDVSSVSVACDLENWYQQFVFVFL